MDASSDSVASSYSSSVPPSPDLVSSDPAAGSVEFTLNRIITEHHKHQQTHKIYCVRFCDVIPSYYNYFASVGSNMASIYRVEEDGSVNLVQSYVDEDIEEDYWVCAWAASPRGMYICTCMYD